MFSGFYAKYCNGTKFLSTLLRISEQAAIVKRAKEPLEKMTPIFSDETQSYNELNGPPNVESRN